MKRSVGRRSRSDELLLAFDTSSSVGSVAVGRGGAVLARASLERRREHAAVLVTAIQRVLEEAETELSGLDGIVVGRGPGSFTGVRIAAATAKGLAFAVDLPLWPRSSLAAGAASHGLAVADLPGASADDLPEPPPGYDAWPRYVLRDARGRRVYAACYRVGPDRIDEVVPPHPATVDEVLDEPLPTNLVFCGDAALRHSDLLRRAGHVVLPPPAGHPFAEGLLKVHALRGDEPPVPPTSRWEPEYVRDSSARPPVRTGTRTVPQPVPVRGEET